MAGDLASTVTCAAQLIVIFINKKSEVLFRFRLIPYIVVIVIHFNWSKYIFPIPTNSSLLFNSHGAFPSGVQLA